MPFSKAPSVRVGPELITEYEAPGQILESNQPCNGPVIIDTDLDANLQDGTNSCKVVRTNITCSETLVGPVITLQNTVPTESVLQIHEFLIWPEIGNQKN